VRWQSPDSSGRRRRFGFGLSPDTTGFSRVETQFQPNQAPSYHKKTPSALAAWSFNFNLLEISLNNLGRK